MKHLRTYESYRERYADDPRKPIIMELLEVIKEQLREVLSIGGFLKKNQRYNKPLTSGFKYPRMHRDYSDPDYYINYAVKYQNYSDRPHVINIVDTILNDYFPNSEKIIMTDTEVFSSTNPYMSYNVRIRLNDDDIRIKDNSQLIEELKEEERMRVEANKFGLLESKAYLNLFVRCENKEEVKEVIRQIGYYKTVIDIKDEILTTSENRLVVNYMELYESIYILNYHDADLYKSDDLKSSAKNHYNIIDITYDEFDPSILEAEKLGLL